LSLPIDLGQKVTNKDFFGKYQLIYFGIYHIVLISGPIHYKTLTLIIASF